MFPASKFRLLLALLGVLLALSFRIRRGRAAMSADPARPPHELRVCADPNNLPFSNRAGRGFENALAALVAKSLRWRLSYTWWPARRGFLRNTLNTGRCDVVMGLPEHFEGVLTTIPVYRSSYVLVQRRDAPKLTSLDDPRLQALRIGVPLVGDDGANPPPIQALVARGLGRNLRGYSVFGNYASPDPLADLIRAVSRTEVDVAVAWGPSAGYYAKRMSPALATALLPDSEAANGSRFTFAIALGVRRGDHALLGELNRVLAQHRGDIEALLRAFDFPTL